MKYVWIWLLLVLSACTAADTARISFGETLSPDEERLVDSLLTLALDNEALYTIAEPIKPISTVLNFSLPIARPDSLPRGIRHAVTPLESDLRRLAQLQTVINRLRIGDVQFFLLPFKRTDRGQRYFEVLAVNLKLLSNIIARDQAFWAQWGFVPNANPAIVLTVVEFEERLDRYRGYGYLFGYPEHAITFFVEAARTEDSTKQFVPRDFFHIPVFSSERGHFTYAVPKGYVPTDVDSAIYRRAVSVLQRYKSLRPLFVRRDGSLDARRLLQALLEQR